MKNLVYLYLSKSYAHKLTNHFKMQTAFSLKMVAEINYWFGGDQFCHSVSVTDRFGDFTHSSGQKLLENSHDGH